MGTAGKTKNRSSEITRYHGLPQPARWRGACGIMRFMTAWIDTHCHLDAAEFSHDRAAVRARAAEQGVGHCVLPAVEVANFAAVRDLAHEGGDSYGLGIHPLCTGGAGDDDLGRLD